MTGSYFDDVQTNEQSQRGHRRLFAIVIAHVLPVLFLFRRVLPEISERFIGQGSDPSWNIWYWNQFSNGQLRLIGPRRALSAALPDGFALSASVRISVFLTDMVGNALLLVFSPVTAYNVALFSFLVLNQVSVTVLARTLGLRIGPALAASIFFVLSPFLLIEAQLHLACTPIFPMIFGLALLLDKSSRRVFRGITAGVCFGSAIYFHPYFFAYSAILQLLGFTVVFLRTRRVREALCNSKHFACGATFLFLAIPAVIGFLLNRSTNAILRSASDLDVFDVGWSAQFQLYGGVLAALSILTLFFITGDSLREIRRLAALLVFIGGSFALGAHFSFGPLLLPTPAALLFDAFGVHRVPGRVLLIAQLGVALLLGLALSELRRTRTLRNLFRIASACILVSGGLSRWQSGLPTTSTVQTEGVIGVLQTNSGPVVEFPLVSFDNNVGPVLIRQLQHQRPIFNGGLSNTPTNHALSDVVAKIESPLSLATLQLAGVQTAIATHREDLPVDLRSSAKQYENFWVSEIPRPKQQVAWEWIGSLGTESTGMWVTQSSGMTLIAHSLIKVRISFEVSSPWTGNVLTGIGKSLVLSSEPKHFVRCLMLAPLGHSFFIGNAQLNFAARDRELSEVDNRKATAFISNLTVEPHC